MNQICDLVRLKLDAICGVVVKYSTRQDRSYYDGSFDRRLFERTIRRIGRHTSWSRKFSMAVMQKADELDVYLERLNTKLINLERFSDSYIFETHPDLDGTNPRSAREEAQQLLEQGARYEVEDARADAESLHKAYSAGERLTCHIALATLYSSQARLGSSPDRDFRFLFSTETRTVEVLVHP
ncbi:hypothetical protein LTR66_009929, partial [Elasticomyces elasticus]